jgi:sec-independent protein translocase protein TatA
MLPNLGPMELVIVMGIAVLLFGKRLPEVGRSLGRGIVEFKKGLNGVVDDMDLNSPAISSYSSSHGSGGRRYDEKPAGESTYDETSVPKFEMPGTASSTMTRVDDPQATPGD